MIAITSFVTRVCWLVQKSHPRQNFLNHPYFAGSKYATGVEFPKFLKSFHCQTIFLSGVTSIN